MNLKPLVKFVLFALAQMRTGQDVRNWGLYRTSRGEFIIAPPKA